MALVLIVSATHGCGFQLRGATQLPDRVSPVYVPAADVSNRLISELTQSLESRGLEVADDRQTAATVLRLLSEESHRRVISVDAGGKAREYELAYEVAFQLDDRNGGVLVARNRIRARRDLTFAREQVLASTREQTRLEQEMRREVVEAVMRRLSAALGEAS